MQAIILAGGFGTRLKPLTEEIPKPMIPVLNKPLMEYSVELLKKYGCDINQDDSYRTNDLYETASNIEERLDLIFHFSEDD